MPCVSTPATWAAYIAYELANMQTNGCQAYVANPGVVDELVPEARVSGSPLMPRVCIWHALNQRAIARRYAKSIGSRYEDLNLIVCHLGGGISVAAHEKGRAIDANNALDGEGPLLSPNVPVHCLRRTSSTFASADATPRSSSNAAWPVRRDSWRTWVRLTCCKF